MEPLNQFFKTFGIDPETFFSISAMVFLFVEFVKKKAGPFLDGIKTDILAILLSFGIGYKAMMPATGDDWINLVIVSLMVWLLGAGFHAKTKK